MLAERTVRLGMPSDEPEVMEMCRMLHEENGDLFPMVDDCVREVLSLAFNKTGGVLGLIGEPGSIEAMIFMLISRIWYTKHWHLEELFNFVRPEHRKSNNAKLLIQFAKRCADDSGLPLIIGVISNTRTEQKVRLYQRQLSKPRGAFFFYNSKWNLGDGDAAGQSA